MFRAMLVSTINLFNPLMHVYNMKYILLTMTDAHAIGCSKYFVSKGTVYNLMLKL